MLISIATGLGMQNEIKKKISAFNGDISIYNFQSTNYEDSNVPMDYDLEISANLSKIKNLFCKSASSVLRKIVSSA